jgi:hypothetical protein
MKRSGSSISSWVGRAICTVITVAGLAVNHSAFASSTAVLSGRVTDFNNAAIVGAKVEANNIDTNITSSTVTNSEGLFVLPNLPPGRYRLFVQKDGFQTIVKSNIALHVQDIVSLSFSMQLGSITQSVTVEGGAPLNQTESAAVATLVDRQFVENLPLNGRSFQSLIALTPGVVLTRATLSDQGQFSVNGQRPNSNYFTIDGVSANIGSSPGSVAGQSTGGSLPGFSALGGTNNLVSVDALQEFKIQTSTYAPEFGRTPGGQISIVTRSGTNEFHGSLFEYFRNDALDSNDWFGNANGQPKPDLRQNDFGGVVGGPLYLPRFGEGTPAFYDGKNRTFFFFSYEGLRLRLPQIGFTTVPSINARLTASASIKPYLETFPRPNGRDLANNLSEFIASYSDPSTLDATSIRTDHNVNAKLTLFGRYNFSPSETVMRGNGVSLNTLNATQIDTKTITAGATLALSSTISNDFRANYSRNEGRAVFSLDDFGGAVPIANSSILPPSVSGEGEFIFNLGTPVGWRSGRFGGDTSRQLNFVNTVSIVAGTHNLKFGGDYRQLFPIFDRASYQQSAVFVDVNQALTGRPSRVSVVAFTGPRRPRLKNLSLFAQDTWKASTKLTLTFGTRWELTPPPHGADEEDPVILSGLENPAAIAVAPPGTELYKISYRNFAPRFGAAYQLSQVRGRETVIRGGFGVFYDLGSTAAAGAFGFGAPYRRSKMIRNTPFPLDPISASAPPFSLTPPFAQLIGLLDPNFKSPYTYQWSATVEQSLGQNQTVTASYVGTIGRRLLRQEVFVSKNPNIVTVNYSLTRSVATSDYNALQLQFQRRLSRGAQALVSYTWSHSIDDVSSDSSSEAPFAVKIDSRQERGPSDFDVRQAFNGALTYDIPSPFASGFAHAFTRNFSIDAIVTARSATPVNILTGAEAAGGSGVSRPDLVPGVSLYLNDPSVGGGRRINEAAFVTPVNRQGTLGRNALRGFSVRQFDLALRRQFSLTERIKLQARSEFFNIFNHPNFGDPGAGGSGTNILTNALFGRSTVMFGRGLGSGGGNGGFNPLYQVGGPRSIQFALKLIF